jgi:glyoxylase-like metal-dependent hydrolase (beta-lactamase superfamily II)
MRSSAKTARSPRQIAAIIGNSGFIVGKTGVVVIDTGISYRHGRRMLEAISRTTGKPVELVIITHAVQEFLFGNAAFDELGIRSWPIGRPRS